MRGTTKVSVGPRGALRRAMGKLEERIKNGLHLGKHRRGRHRGGTGEGKMILNVHLSEDEQPVTEVPVTPQTTCRDVVEACKEPGEGSCQLVESWQGCERAVADNERMAELLQRWGAQRAEVRFYIRHGDPLIGLSGQGHDVKEVKVLESQRGQTHSSKHNGVSTSDHRQENRAGSPGVELTLTELQEMASRQQQQIEAQQHLLVAKEQRLRFLKQQEARRGQQVSSGGVQNSTTQPTAESEKLRVLRERMESQEAKLRRIRAMRGQAETSRLLNKNLALEIEQAGRLFQEKQRELQAAVARVDQLSRQLDELSATRIPNPTRPGYNTGNPAVVQGNHSLDQLYRELQLRNKLNQEQSAKLQQQRDLLNRRNQEVITMDRRIRELRERLRSKKATAQHKENIPVGLADLGSQRTPGGTTGRVAAVGPIVQTPTASTATRQVRPDVPETTDGPLKPPAILPVSFGSAGLVETQAVTTAVGPSAVAPTADSTTKSYVRGTRPTCLALLPGPEASLASNGSELFAASGKISTAQCTLPGMGDWRQSCLNGSASLRATHTAQGDTCSPTDIRLTTKPLEQLSTTTCSGTHNPEMTAEQPIQNGETTKPSLLPVGKMKANASLQHNSTSNSTGQPLVEPIAMCRPAAPPPPLRAWQGGVTPPIPPPPPPRTSHHIQQRITVPPTPLPTDGHTQPPAIAVRPFSALPDRPGSQARSQSPRKAPSSQTVSSIYSVYTQPAAPPKNFQQAVLNALSLQRTGKANRHAGSSKVPASIPFQDNEASSPNSPSEAADSEVPPPPRPLSPTKLLPVTALPAAAGRCQSEADLEALRRRLANAPRPLKKRSSISEGEEAAPGVIPAALLQKALYQRLNPLAGQETAENSSSRPPPPPPPPPFYRPRWPPSYSNAETGADKSEGTNCVLPNESGSDSSSTMSDDLPLPLPPPPLCNDNSDEQNNNNVGETSTDEEEEEGNEGSESERTDLPPPPPYPIVPDTDRVPTVISSTAPLPPGKRTNLKKTGSERTGQGLRVRFDPLAILLDAALEGDYELVQRALYEVPEPSQPNDEGITALHNAVCAGHMDIVRLLVQHGVNVNAADSDGWTPLHCAASCNNVHLCKILVESGAAVFATTISDSETAADKCEEMESGFQQCSQFLYGVQEKLGLMNKSVVFALWNCDPEQDDELQLHEGEALSILRRGQDEQPEWWWARRAEQEGYVPRNLLGLYPRIKPRPRTLA
uniref:Protein phosphatase 1, regulatory subunit 13Bb n=2 Tax=Eptatretus burgeri TaxID=7764 RepID=A0A8C4R5F6_EPTBU